MSQSDAIPQAVAVSFRRQGDRIEFCLITSMSRGNWIFPKGIVDPGETPEVAAVREAGEEAGIQGHIVGKPLGKYRDKKWGRELRVVGLLMEVTECDDEWPEMDARQRCWVSPSEALERLEKPEFREFVELALERLETD